MKRNWTKTIAALLLASACLTWGQGQARAEDQLPMGRCGIKMPLETLRSYIFDYVDAGVTGNYSSGPWCPYPLCITFRTELDWTHINVHWGAETEWSDDDFIRIRNRVTARETTFMTVWDKFDIVIDVKLVRDDPDPNNPDPCGAGEVYPNVIVTRVEGESVGSWPGYTVPSQSKLADDGYSRCDMQQLAQSIFAPLFEEALIGPVEGDRDPGTGECYEGGEDLSGTCRYTLRLRDLYETMGGMLIDSDNAYLLIPYVHAGSVQRGCSHGISSPIGATADLFGEGWPTEYKDSLAGLVAYPGQLLDWPKQIHEALVNIPEAQTFGLSVHCNHGPYCPGFSPLTPDSDGDGFCDPLDYCQNTFTGSNCDADGDGVGDGALYDENICGLVAAQELGGVYGSREEMLLDLQLYCGGCDNCSEANPDQHDRDGDGVGDGISTSSGEECDPDSDGDGILNEYDCDELNSNVGLDLDGDGRCEDGHEPWPTDWNSPDPPPIGYCYQKCVANSAMYTGYDEDACRERCLRDNCFYADIETDPFCSHVAPCILLGNDCNQTLVFNHCVAVYGNLDQDDLDGDGVGDKCEQHAVSSLEFERMPAGEYMFPGEAMGWHNAGQYYRISFQTRGGAVTPDSSDPPAPVYNPDTRTRTQVGACACDYTDANGNWDEILCGEPDRCPRDRERANNIAPMSWSPINAPECNNYPLASGLFPSQEAIILQYSICYARSFDFTRQPGPWAPWYGAHGDQHTFHWEWEYTRDYSNGQNISSQFERIQTPTGERTTGIRVFWPVFGQTSVNYFPPDQEVAFSRNRSVHVSAGGTQYFELVPLDAGTLDARIPRRAPRQFFDPADRGIWARLPGYLLGHDPVTERFRLYGLKGGAPEVEMVWELSAPEPLSTQRSFSGTGGFVREDLLGGAGQTMQAGVFLYQAPRVVQVGETGGAVLIDAKLYAGTEPTGVQLDLVDVADLTGTTTPSMLDAQLIWMESTQQLLVLGSVLGSGDSKPGSQQNAVVWRLSLMDGSWDGPHQIALPLGYTAQLDPVAGKVLVFGGHGSKESSAVYRVDPLTWSVRELALAEPAPADVARRGAGSYLDVPGRALYVYGGERDGVGLTDAWKLDLATRRWRSLVVGSTTGSPGARARPLVYYDRYRGSLWVGDFATGDVADGLDLWALDAQGSWHQSQSLMARGANQWPVYDFFSPGKDNRYLWPTDQTAGWPGQLLLALLEPDRPVLGLRVSARNGNAIGSSDPVNGSQEAAFFCPVGQHCHLRVTGESGDAAWTSFGLRVSEAELALEAMTSPQGPINDLVQQDDNLYITGPWGLRVLDTQTLGQIGSLGGAGVSAAKGLEPCGEYLCLAQLGPPYFKVLDVSDASNPVVKADLPTAGPAWDLAVQSHRAYLAHGNSGVGRYEVSRFGSPTYVGTLSPGGNVGCVAVHDDLLAAGRKDGLVVLYDVTDVPLQAGELQAKGRISRLRYYAGFLWVRGKNGSWVEVWDVSDPAVPVKLGELGPGTEPLFHMQVTGSRVFTIEGNRVKVYRAQPVGP